MESLFGGQLYTTGDYRNQNDDSTNSHTNKEVAIRLEISNYRAMPPIHVNMSPMTWWKKHDNQFPTLSLLAKRCLATPSTSVPSEQVFSCAGHIVSAKRNRLDPSNVDMLLFLNKNV
jgi:hypothetical protein